MAPTLYMTPASPPVRAVLITAKALGVQFEEKQVELTKSDHLTPEYLKLNPQHTVPTLVDEDGFIVWDSHAIMPYLVSKYGKDDSLYPKDLKKRATVDQRLHFESGVVFPSAVKILSAIFRSGKTSIDDNDKTSLNEVYGFLEAFLDGKPWVAGDSKTIADYSIYSSTTLGNVLVPIDGQKYPRVTAWLKKVDALPETEVSKKGLAILEQVVKSRLK